MNVMIEVTGTATDLDTGEEGEEGAEAEEEGVVRDVEEVAVDMVEKVVGMATHLRPQRIPAGLVNPSTSMDSRMTRTVISGSSV